jgi:hypothetical protein
LNSDFDHSPEGICLAESKFAIGPIVCDHPLFDLFRLSIAMGAFYDLLGNAIDIVLKVRLPWAIGNPLIKDENYRASVPGDMGDCQLRDWRFCGRAVKGMLLKIRIRTNQKRELMAAWNKDAIHVTNDVHLPASTCHVIRLKKANSGSI